MLLEVSQQTDREIRLIEAHVEAGIQQALAHIALNYENPEYPFARLAYHVRKHTQDVINRTRILLTAMHAADADYVTERDILLGVLAAAFHDTMLIWELEYKTEKDVPVVKKAQRIGQNERLSYERAENWMNQKSGLYVQADFAHVQEAIYGTIPALDLATGTVTQPHINKNSHPITLAVALSDLGTALMAEPWEFTLEGDTYFRELYTDFIENIGLENILLDPKLAEQVKAVVMQWARNQIHFVEVRLEKLTETLGYFKDTVQPVVAGIVSHGEETLEHAKAEYIVRAQMEPIDLLKRIGYTID